MKFKVGDRVKVIWSGYDFVNGKCGVVRSVDKIFYAVELDEENPVLHNCGGLCKSYHGWYCKENNLEKADKPNKTAPKAKFKVGDKVVANNKAKELYHYGVTVPGWRGTVVGCEGNALLVEGKGTQKGNSTFWVYSDAFDFVSSEKPKRTIVLTITDDGADAKLVCGKKVKKTASIKRYYKDKPNDYRAAIFSVGKLFGRELKITEAGVSLSADEVRKMKDSLKNAQGYLDDAKVILERNAAEK